MTTKKYFFISLIVLSTIFSGCSAFKGSSAKTNTNSAGLIGTVSSQLGVTEEQAMLGTAAVLILARTKMTPEEFQKVTSTMSGVNSILQNTNNMSKLPSTIGSMAELYTAVSNLGIRSSLIDSIVPLVLTYAQVTGGNNSYLPLQTALKK